MALNGLVTASAPTSYGLNTKGVIQNLVLTLPIKAATAITANDLVCLSTGVVGCTAVTDKVMGMAVASVSNASGAYGDKVVGVVVQGVIEQDALTQSSTHTSISIGSILYLAPAVSSYCAAGQALSVSNGSSAVQVGRSLDVVTQPSGGSQINVVRVYVDFMNAVPAKAWL